jgi:hypothetical protein
MVASSVEWEERGLVLVSDEDESCAWRFGLDAAADGLAPGFEADSIHRAVIMPSLVTL